MMAYNQPTTNLSLMPQTVKPVQQQGNFMPAARPMPVPDTRMPTRLGADKMAPVGAPVGPPSTAMPVRPPPLRPPPQVRMAPWMKAQPVPQAPMQPPIREQIQPSFRPPGLTPGHRGGGMNDYNRRQQMAPPFLRGLRQGVPTPENRPMQQNWLSRTTGYAPQGRDISSQANLTQNWMSRLQGGYGG